MNNKWKEWATKLIETILAVSFLYQLLYKNKRLFLKNQDMLHVTQWILHSFKNKKTYSTKALQLSIFPLLKKYKIYKNLFLNIFILVIKEIVILLVIPAFKHLNLRLWKTEYSQKMKVSFQLQGKIKKDNCKIKIIVHQFRLRNGINKN